MNKKKKNIWNKYNENVVSDIHELVDGYKDFISECKTERICVTKIKQLAEEAGFIDVDSMIKKGGQLKPGDKFYRSYMKKTILLGVCGKFPISEGMNILGAHIDSPRLDLKQNPLYEKDEICYFDTHYYGGIKKYQWVTLPLALHGVVAKKDGTVIDVNIGDSETDPVFCVSDLLVHLSEEQLEKKAKQVIDGEALDIIIGSIPSNSDENSSVKDAVLNLLKQKYEIEEDDFISAEIEVVPAGKARDLGFDRSMVIGYGQDDRICAYTSLKAILNTDEIPQRTSLCILTDKEEIGSMGATGMQSRFFENTLAEFMELSNSYSEIDLRRSLERSYMLSSDVSAAFDPSYESVFEKNNAAYLGHGIVFNKYTGARGKSGSNDANAEYVAKLRNVLDKNDIAFQTAELGKVDAGGGGTIAYILGNLGMNVIDSGMAILCMHSPWEVSSKVDIYEGYRAYKAFLKYME